MPWTDAARANRWHPRSDAQWVELLLSLTVPDENGCLVYNRKTTNRSGHIQRYFKGRSWYVHRLMWTLVKGPVPDGLQVCHTCDNPKCINIDHLWLGTQRDNSLDMVSKRRQKFMSKTECKNGHAFTPENTWVCSRGHRHCRACARMRQRVASGWNYEEAAASALVPIPQNAPTPRRWRGNVSG
jgi:hypothetical protein